MLEILLVYTHSTYFFSAGFRQVSARVPPGSAAGFRRVPPCCAGFRRVPPGSAVSCCAWFRQAGSCRVAANKVSALDSPSICVVSAAFPLVRLPLLLYAATFQPGFCHDCAKFLASVGQACGNQRRAVYKCPDIAQVSLWKNHEKSPIRGLHISTWKLPAFIDFCIEHVCG